jgi:hypothetical protein
MKATLGRDLTQANMYPERLMKTLPRIPVCMIRFYSIAYKGQHTAQPLSIKPPAKLSKSNLTMRTLCESIEEYLLLEMVNHHLGSFLLLWADVAAGKVLLIVTFD